MKLLNCHCKKIQIEVDTDLKNLVRCNCSICKKKGAVMAIVGPGKLRVLKGEEDLSMYQFHSKVAKHFFCSICGIYTHHNPRRDPKMFGFNVGCIDGIDTLNIKDLKVIDGANHPLDKKNEET